MNKFPNHQSDKDPGNHKPVKPMIMVVDDEDSVLKMIELILEEEGYQVEPCLTGKEAIDKFNNWHIYMSPVVIISWLLRSFSPIIETLLSTGPPAIACSNNRIISRMAILCRLLLLESSRYAYLTNILLRYKRFYHYD